MPSEVIKKVTNNPSGSISLLIGGILVAVGPWAATLDNWADALTTQHVGVLLPIIGGVFLAWLGKSPTTK